MGVVREFRPQGDPVRRGTARFIGMPSYASCPYTAEYDAQLAETGPGNVLGRDDRPARARGDVVCARRLPAAPADAGEVRRRLRHGRPHQGGEERRGTGAHPPHRDDAGQGDGGNLRADPSRHARAGSRGDRRARRPQARQRAGTVPHRLGPGRQRRRCSPTATSRTACCARATSSPSSSRTTAPGGFYTELGRTCVLGRASQEMKDEFAFVLEAQKFTARSDETGREVQRDLCRVQRLHEAQRAPRGKASRTPTARATTWSSARWCATTSP